GVVVPGLTGIIGWQWAFLTVALVSLLCAVAIQPLCASLDDDKNPQHKLSFGNGLAGPLRLVFSHRSLAVLAGVSFLFSITQVSLTTYMVTYLHEDLGMSLIVAGFILAVAQTAGVIGRLLWGYISDRFLGPIRMLACLALLIGVCALVTPLLKGMGTYWLILIVLAVFGSCAIGWNSVYLAEVARQAPAGQASIASGGSLSMTFLGVVVGPPLFGLIASITGSYGAAFAALTLPVLVCLWLLWRYRADFVAAQP